MSITTDLSGKTFLVTGGAHRVGAMIAEAIAQAGGDLIIHYRRSEAEAHETKAKLEALGAKVRLLQADLEDEEACRSLIEEAFAIAPLKGLINNAAYFERGGWQETTMAQWHKHLQLNLTAPFVLMQRFSQLLPRDRNGTILNIVDLCAQKPRTSHIAYATSKAALESLTRIAARSLAPRIGVNALALGAILPPSDGGDTQSALRELPVARLASAEELQRAALFLLTNSSYITGEIVHLDGGKHLI